VQKLVISGHHCAGWSPNPSFGDGKVTSGGFSVTMVTNPFVELVTQERAGSKT
jgi:hypothetical protein